MKSFDYFGASAHYYNYDHRYNVLLQQLLHEADRRDPPRTILDIGCGEGIGQISALNQVVRDVAERYWAVEPDPEVTIPACFDQAWRTSFESADIPAAGVDLAYCYMVLEHIADPKGFLRQLDRILAPGGTLVALTINADSLFGRLSRMAHVTGIQDRLVAALRGKEESESYHYPAVYRLNTQRAIEKLLKKSGTQLSRVDVCYLERGETNSYLRGPLMLTRPIFRTLIRLRPSWYTSLLIRIQKEG